MIHYIPGAHNRERICWACTIDISGKYRNSWSLDKALSMYEHAVEIIEAQTGHFKIRDIGLIMVNSGRGYGYSAWNTAANAVHDMAGHSLLRCIRRSHGGRVCQYWEVVR